MFLLTGRSPKVNVHHNPKVHSDGVLFFTSMWVLMYFSINNGVIYWFMCLAVRCPVMMLLASLESIQEAKVAVSHSRASS